MYPRDQNRQKVRGDRGGERLPQQQTTKPQSRRPPDPRDNQPKGKQSQAASNAKENIAKSLPKQSQGKQAPVSESPRNFEDAKNLKLFEKLDKMYGKEPVTKVNSRNIYAEAHPTVPPPSQSQIKPPAQEKKQAAQNRKPPLASSRQHQQSVTGPVPPGRQQVQPKANQFGGQINRAGNYNPAHARAPQGRAYIPNANLTARDIGQGSVPRIPPFETYKQVPVQADIPPQSYAPLGQQGQYPTRHIVADIPIFMTADGYQTGYQGIAHETLAARPPLNPDPYTDRLITGAGYPDIPSTRRPPIDPLRYSDHGSAALKPLGNRMMDSGMPLTYRPSSGENKRAHRMDPNDPYAPPKRQYVPSFGAPHSNPESTVSFRDDQRYKDLDQLKYSPDKLNRGSRNSEVADRQKPKTDNYKPSWAGSPRDKERPWKSGNSRPTRRQDTLEELYSSRDVQRNLMENDIQKWQREDSWIKEQLSKSKDFLAMSKTKSNSGQGDNGEERFRGQGYDYPSRSVNPTDNQTYRPSPAADIVRQRQYNLPAPQENQGRRSPDKYSRDPRDHVRGQSDHYRDKKEGQIYKGHGHETPRDDPQIRGQDDPFRDQGHEERGQGDTYRGQGDTYRVETRRDGRDDTERVFDPAYRQDGGEYRQAVESKYPPQGGYSQDRQAENRRSETQEPKRNSRPESDKKLEYVLRSKSQDPNQSGQETAGGQDRERNTKASRLSHQSEPLMRTDMDKPGSRYEDVDEKIRREHEQQMREMKEKQQRDEERQKAERDALFTSRQSPIGSERDKAVPVDVRYKEADMTQLNKPIHTSPRESSAQAYTDHPSSNRDPLAENPSYRSYEKKPINIPLKGLSESETHPHPAHTFRPQGSARTEDDALPTHRYNPSPAQGPSFEADDIPNRQHQDDIPPLSLRQSLEPPKPPEPRRPTPRPEKVRERTMDSQGPTRDDVQPKTDSETLTERERRNPSASSQHQKEDDDMEHEDKEDLNFDLIEEEYPGNDMYMCYLMTDDGAAIGPLKLDIEDVQVGLPRPIPKPSEETGELKPDNDEEGRGLSIKYFSL